MALYLILRARRLHKCKMWDHSLRGKNAHKTRHAILLAANFKATQSIKKGNLYKIALIVSYEALGTETTGGDCPSHPCQILENSMASLWRVITSNA